LRWRGFGWKTDATAASQSVDFRSFVRPIQGTSAPTGALDFQASINAGAYTTLVSITSDSTGACGSPCMTIGGGTGKIDVGTVDPPYFIGGVKYSTYLPGMTGVKEETTGAVKLSRTNSFDNFSYAIDFAKETAGSDLWLFSQTTDWGQNMKNLVVLVSSTQEKAKVWYAKDAVNNRLIIYGNCNCEVSYRLTAPRFDYLAFPNIHPNQDGGGFQPNGTNYNYTNSTSGEEIIFTSNELTVAEQNGQIVNLDPEQLRTGLASLGLVVNPNGTLAVDTLKTRELCVGSICVTEDQFKTVFGQAANGNQVSAGNLVSPASPAGGPEPEPAPEPAPTPVPEESAPPEPEPGNQVSPDLSAEASAKAEGNLVSPEPEPAPAPVPEESAPPEPVAAIQ